MTNDAMMKCVMVLDADFPVGLIANTATVLALTLGKKLDNIIGPDIADASGCLHVGITTTPIPILKSTSALLREIRAGLIEGDYSDVFVVDFTDAAQLTKTYDDYTRKLSATSQKDLKYLGLAMYGPKKKINKLTGSLPLLR